LITSQLPRRGEIWAIDFTPVTTIGGEIIKTRPAVVVSSDAAARIPIKIIAPIIDWKNYFAQNFWHVKIEPDIDNGLTKISAIDTLQLRGIDIQKFSHQIGKISESQMREITLAIVILIEYQETDPV
jgi:mRNA interferase MazF